MARKKRQYIRHKPVPTETMPASVFVLGLLPLVIMAALVGVYFWTQYQVTVPQISVQLPTISFDPQDFLSNTASFVGEIFGAMQTAVTNYFQTLGSVFVNFYDYVRPEEKIAQIFSAIVYPLHFLDPRPLFRLIAHMTKSSEDAIGAFFSPLVPIINYCLHSFRETWQSLLDSFKGIVQLVDYITKHAKN